MTLSIEPVVLGRTALDALAGSIRLAQAGDPLAAVTVIVPTNTAGVGARRFLARSGGIAAVQFLTIYRLADLLAGHVLAGSGRRPLTTPVLNATLRASLADTPGIFSAVSNHEATVDGLRSSYRELRELPPRFVETLGRSGSAMVTEVIRVNQDVRRRLRKAWYDETDLLLEAAHLVDPTVGPSVNPSIEQQFGRIVVHLPERLSSAALDLIVVLSRVTDLRIAAGVTGDERADERIRRLAASVSDRCDLDFDSIRWPAPADIDSHIDVVDVSDADDEIRVVVRRVIRAAREGVPFERIAVLWSSVDPYARAVTEALDAAGIPWNGPSPTRLAERLAGRALLGVLTIDQFGFRRRDVFAWLSTTPVRDDQRRPVPTAQWERISREAGVGWGDWGERLSRYERSTRLVANGHRSTGDEYRADRADREAGAAADLNQFVTWLRAELGEATAPRRWDAWGKWSHRMLNRLLGNDAARSRLPADEQSSLEQVEAAVDRLSGLDEVARPVDRLGFAAALEAELHAALGRVGRIGDGVLLGPLSTAVGLSAQLTIVVGAVDGKLPAAPQGDPLISDSDRHLVPLLRTSSDAIADQRRHLISALRSAPELLIGVPRGDLRRSAQHTASRWLDQLVPPGCRHNLHHPSFTHGLGALEFPATPSEYRVRSLLGHVRTGHQIDSHGLAFADEAFGRNLRLVRARESSMFTEFDGNLSAAQLPSPIAGGQALSPTQLEKWASCPHRYFIERLLGVNLVDDRDDDIRMTPIDRGTLMHSVFDGFLQLVLNDVLPCPAPDEAWSSIHREAAFAQLDATATEYEESGRTGRELLWRFDRNRLRSELRRWLDRDDHERAELSTRPVGSEERFGFDDSSWPAALVELADGRQLRFRGSIDRLDRDDVGAWRITDHKTGSAKKLKVVKATNPVDGGRRLQLGVYAAAVATHLGISPIGVTSEYSITTRVQGSPRAGYVVTEEIWEVFVEALTRIIDGIAGGLFPPLPPKPSFFLGWVECPVCDPDGLGTTEGYRASIRKQSDPLLAPILALSGGPRS